MIDIPIPMAAQCGQPVAVPVVPITLNLIQGVLASAGDEENSVYSRPGKDARLNEERPLRILIVEDEILTADYTRYLLSELGYEVCGHATNANSALSLAEAERPDLILMDITLGRGEDGVSAARRIGDKFGIRSLFVTAYGDQVTLDRIQAVNPLGVLLKPFDKERLRVAISAAVYGA